LARINIEDSFFSDQRFRVLARLIGDETRAIGVCVQAWFLAQKYWKEGRQLVPRALWDKCGFAPLIDAELAEVQAEGVYCRGSKRQFAWLVDENRVAAGKRSAEARRKKFGTAVPIHAANHPSAEQNPEQTELPVRSRSKSAPNKTPNCPPNENRTGPNSLTPTQFGDISEAPGGSDVWAAYDASYRARYGTAPVRNARVNSMCAQLVKRLGGDAAVAVVRFYVQHQNGYYVQKSHALGPCVADAEALHTQWKTNVIVTRASASHADKNGATLQAFQNVAARWAAEKGTADDGE
jgi:hypothetical protein